jgi:NO-binding membrane sensor protein with MHYT domain
MPILVFIVIASTGLFTTRTLLRIVLQLDGHPRTIFPLTLAFGMGLTWLFSFIAPIAVANNFKIDFYLFEFILITSLGVWIVTYIIGIFTINYIQRRKH